MYYTFYRDVNGDIKCEEVSQKAKFHFKKYDDPGHGYFAIKKAYLHKLGIAEKISSYSYEKGATAYLEEDCDGSLFIDTLVAKKIPFTIEYKHTNKSSPIRSYNSHQG